jgi:hypothetical protein
LRFRLPRRYNTVPRVSCIRRVRQEAEGVKHTEGTESAELAESDMGLTFILFTEGHIVN